MLPSAAFVMLWSLALFTLVALCLLYAARCLFRFRSVRAEFAHHVGVNYLFAPWISWLLLLQSTPFLRPHTRSYLLLCWLFSLPILALDIKIYGQWFTKGKKFLSMVANPTSQITVIGNLVGARAAAQMGWRESAVCMFSLGIAHYLVLFVTLYQRFLGSDSLPAMLRPVFFLFFAAPSMASLAWDSISSSFDTSCKMLFFLSLFLFASVIIVSFLLYKIWARKHRIMEDTLSGGKMVMFRSPRTQSLTSKAFVKKTMKLTNKDIIGSGGYGTVYRLIIDDNSAFAVKKLNKGNTDRDRGFERELNAMGDIKHRNIVTLHGYYIAPQFNLLIYELMPNGSLDALLHGNSVQNIFSKLSCFQYSHSASHKGIDTGKSGKEKPLDWPSRCKIAVGAARGLSYLHHDCIPHIIHRDIKSSNILLDQNMEARVSDFGLATLMEPDKSHVTTIAAGTFGYLAPEYFDSGRATTKGDVYSFGVVLLELLTGKRPTDESFIEEGTKPVTWVKAVVKDKREEHAIDSSLLCFPMEEVKKVFNIAEKCLESDPSKRPTMAALLKMLEQINQTNL
ncbi:putative Receptor-like serine/threonine-protein kinase [Cocos nucifera]|uniref:Putative Receptor-like serine/threonine-protein kinase n=1 Tax=Cocos nucifera TaxID=13894 RepID=A0A8K0I403_COCNU|nr:putative Receptor-like serine/threonine-protein kinase [Cocos nucifera]